ncbi:uncharacterized protein FSUBG_6031 [Fusarium subglutinans]|uniref:Uncharacterized protein n=1 Tax=Gibberella subglutinans TaxID=42677 RepID=A0A8H5V311_GIBSU|nr:uncharacterized protein FSUBG_6031 [Fusarium subglutinans]KAF5606424.1 hypothetical protein FSUBG_6031 [Fusarium subglutinans]
MDWLTQYETYIRKRLELAQDRVTLAQELVVALNHELRDILRAQNLQGAQSHTEEEIEQYSLAVERPDFFPSKAYLLIDPIDCQVITSTLDPRFDQVRGSPVGVRGFYETFLRTVFLSPWQYPIRYFTLRHPKAATCPIKLQCENWLLVEENILQTRGRWDIDIRYTAIRADFVAGGYSGVNMFDDKVESDRISTLTCRIFNYLQLGFSAVEQRGYQVLDWHMYEPDNAGYGGDEINRLKLMDQFGPRIFENLEQAYT